MSVRCQAHDIIFDSVQGELLCPFFPENVCVAILPTNATLNLLSFSIATVKIAAVPLAQSLVRIFLFQKTSLKFLVKSLLTPILPIAEVP
jgi:hypothetical protein